MRFALSHYDGVSMSAANDASILHPHPIDMASRAHLVYVNGDHNIPAVFTSTEAEGGITKTLKIRQIEPEFLSRMFDVEEA